MIHPVAELALFTDNKGSKLKMPPTIYLSPRPNEAIAEVTDFNGKLVSIGIDDTGNGYTSPPEADIVGGGGGGASIELIAPGTIENMLDLTPGLNYIGTPNVIFNGIGIKAEASCEISGYISSVDIADCGSNYSYPPEIIVETQDSAGRGAVLKANISGYIYKTVLLSGGKFPIDVIPTINIVSSGNVSYGGSIVPSMRPIDSNYSTIHSLSIQSPGSGYPQIPSIAISGYIPGFPALAYCLINGGISSIDIINPGSGYTSIPTLKVIRREPVLPISSGNADFIYQIIESQTPTQTPTVTPSFTPSFTPTKTVTVTNTCTNTITSTQQSTSTPTPTRTPVSSPTNRTLHGPIGTNLPTSTISPSPTTTKTVTPSSTVTSSFTASPTVTRTQTQTPTITRTSTSTPTITKTSTQTPTFSATQTLTPSQTINILNPAHDAILIPRMRYSVSKINILQGGRYKSDPTITVKPPVVANNKAVITNPGSYCFGSKPSVKIRGSTISSPYRKTKEPEAIPVINYGIGYAEIINPGYNYTIPPTIKLIGGYDPIKGSPGSILVAIENGSATSISINSIGAYYRTAPYISISSNDYGYGLEIKVKLSGVLEDIYITDPGLNLTYDTPNTTVFIEGGDGPIDAEAHITLTDENDSQYGYGCTATPELNYRVTGAKIIDGGEFYQYSPRISISGNQKDFSSPARPAKAQARIKGVVDTISITNGGDNYATGFACNVLKNNTIFLYGNGINGTTTIQDLLVGAATDSGNVPLMNSGNYKFNTGIFSFQDSCLNAVFYEKPLVGFSDTNRLEAKTYLETSSIGVSITGVCENINTHYITTKKIDNINNQLAYINAIKSIFGNTNNIKINNLSDIDNNYASCTDTAGGSEFYFYDGRYFAPRDPFLSVQGELVGLSLTVGERFFGIYCPSAYNYAVTSPSNIDKSHFIAMPAFFDTLPELSIEDCEGTSANVTLSQKSNGLTSIYDYNPDLSGDYMIDDYTADGHSDLSITGGIGYSSYSTLVCLEPGIPKSWNNKPEFSVNINNNGEIISVDIVDGGKGFYPQSAANVTGLAGFFGRDKNFHIYFTGGGGSGGFATYGTDVGDYSPETRRMPIGSIYSAEGIIETVTVVSGGTGYRTPPTAVVVDYNTTWKEFYLHNKIYDKYIDDTPEESERINGVDAIYSIGPFQIIDFYFKNAMPYDYRFSIKNQTSYYPSNLDTERSTERGSDSQAYISTVIPFNSISYNPGSYPYVAISGFHLYNYMWDRGWLGYQHFLNNNAPGSIDYGPVPNRYSIDYFYDNGYINDILYANEDKYIAYPHTDNTINIANNNEFMNLIDIPPEFRANKFSWEENNISSSILIRTNTIE